MGERSPRRLLIMGANSVIIKRHVHARARPVTWLAQRSLDGIGRTCAQQSASEHATLIRTWPANTIKPAA